MIAAILLLLPSATCADPLAGLPAEAFDRILRASGGVVEAVITARDVYIEGIPVVRASRADFHWPEGPGCGRLRRAVAAYAFDYNGLRLAGLRPITFYSDPWTLQSAWIEETGQARTREGQIVTCRPGLAFFVEGGRVLSCAGWSG